MSNYQIIASQGEKIHPFFPVLCDNNARPREILSVGTGCWRDFGGERFLLSVYVRCAHLVELLQSEWLFSAVCWHKAASGTSPAYLSTNSTLNSFQQQVQWRSCGCLTSSLDQPAHFQ